MGLTEYPNDIATRQACAAVGQARLMSTYSSLFSNFDILVSQILLTTEDIQALAAPVLRHRIVVNFAAESEGVTTDKVVERMIAETPSKESDLSRDPRFKNMFAA